MKQRAGTLSKNRRSSSLSAENNAEDQSGFCIHLLTYNIERMFSLAGILTGMKVCCITSWN